MDAESVLLPGMGFDLLDLQLAKVGRVSKDDRDFQARRFLPTGILRMRLLFAGYQQMESGSGKG